MGFQTIGRTGNIKSMQRVQIAVASGTGVVTATAAITAINPGLSEIFNLGCVYGATNSQAPSYAVDLVNSTTIAIYTRGPVNSNTVYIQITEHF